MSLAEPKARPVDLTIGDLEIRLAESEAEVAAAQALRYRVFYEEMSATPTPEMAAAHRDFDSFDPFCDHLVVLDTRKGGGPAGIVATYRLMRRSAAARRGQFYSVDEYDISAITAHPGEILELGRSCVDASYRSKGDKEADAYEELLLDVMKGDHSLFLRYDEVEWAWRVVDPVLKVWSMERDFINTYAAGTWGPRGTYRLFDRDDQFWRHRLSLDGSDVGSEAY